MSAAAVAALVVTGVLISALSVYLLWVVVILRHLTDTLGKVTFGVAAIAYRVTPVQSLVEGINGDLVAVAGELDSLCTDLGAVAGSMPAASVRVC